MTEQEIKEFLGRHSLDINNENLDSVYHDCSYYEDKQDITRFLLSLNIDPTEYVSEIYDERFITINPTRSAEIIENTCNWLKGGKFKIGFDYVAEEFSNREYHTEFTEEALREDLLERFWDSADWVDDTTCDDYIKHNLNKANEQALSKFGDLSSDEFKENHEDIYSELKAAVRDGLIYGCAEDAIQDINGQLEFPDFVKSYTKDLDHQNYILDIDIPKLLVDEDFLETLDINGWCSTAVREAIQYYLNKHKWVEPLGGWYGFDENVFNEYIIWNIDLS